MVCYLCLGVLVSIRDVAVWNTACFCIGIAIVRDCGCWCCGFVWYVCSCDWNAVLILVVVWGCYCLVNCSVVCCVGFGLLC